MIRLSYSILDPWSKGDIDEALRRYWRVEQEPTQAMIEGRRFHQLWQDETDKTGKMPEIFGGKELVKPQTELKLEVMLEPWLQFVGIIDLYDQEVIFDYKTGKTPVSAYSSSFQPLCYQVLLSESGLTPKESVFLQFNQHINKVKKSKRYLDDQTYKAGREWIITFASEMYSALQESKEL